MLQVYLSMLDTADDVKKFEELYETYGRLMKYVAARVLHDDGLAEDAVQEAFLRIARNFSGVGEIRCPETKRFVVIITERAALNLLHKEKKHYGQVSLDEMLEEHGTDYGISAVHGPDADQVFETIQHDLLVEAILALPKIYREVMYLHGVYMCTLAETADLLAISEEAAKKRMQRGRRLLRKELGGEEF